MTIPIADPELGAEERERALEVIESGHLAHGEEVERFERGFADYADADHAVAVANGTAALHATLEAAGVEPGDAVVTTPFSFVATANAIRFAGGVPAFADIDPETYNIDPHAVEALLRERGQEISAIVPVHLYGLPAAMNHLRELAETHDVALIEDAAQAHGAEYDGRPVGALGDAGCFSFYPTKNMTTGEGGMVTTDDPQIAERVRQFINHGRRPEGGSYEHATLGHNLRMTNIAGAIGRAQLDRLPEFVSARRENARRLTEGLADVAGVTPPAEPPGLRHAYHQYTVRCEDRDALRRALDERGVDSRVYYPTCIHELEAYERFETEAPHAERATQEVLSVPVHPNVTEEQIDTIVESISRAYASHA